MDALLLASGSVLGVAVGAVLDPVGQHLADRSRANDERRRAERDERRAAEAADGLSGSRGAPVAPAAVPELHPVESQTGEPHPTEPQTTEPHPTEPVWEESQALVGDGVPTPPEDVRHLVPAGRSPARTVVAALVTGGLFALAVSHYTGSGRFEAPWLAAPLCVFLAMAVVVSVTDLSHRLVPRQLLYGALAVIVPLYVILSAHYHHWHPLVDAAVAGAIAFGLFFVIWFVVPRGMGFGDVRLAGVIGVTVGYLDLLHAYLAFLVGFVLGLVFGLVLMVTSSSGRRTRIPFAPALCAGAVIAILWGDPLVHHVFHAHS